MYDPNEVAELLRTLGLNDLNLSYSHDLTIARATKVGTVEVVSGVGFSKAEAIENMLKNAMEAKQ